jgi:hypothetical protein
MSLLEALYMSSLLILVALLTRPCSQVDQ